MRQDHSISFSSFFSPNPQLPCLETRDDDNSCCRSWVQNQVQRKNVNVSEHLISLHCLCFKNSLTPKLNNSGQNAYWLSFPIFYFREREGERTSEWASTFWITLQMSPVTEIGMKPEARISIQICHEKRGQVFEHHCCFPGGVHCQDLELGIESRYSDVGGRHLNWHLSTAKCPSYSLYINITWNDREQWLIQFLRKDILCLHPWSLWHNGNILYRLPSPSVSAEQEPHSSPVKFL